MEKDSTFDHSVSHCIAQIRNGEDPSQAQRFIFDRYVRQLSNIAKKKLARGGIVDGEDVALSALNSFFMKIRKDDAYSNVYDRDSLLSLLTTIATRKAINYFYAETAQKRGGGKVVGENILAGDYDGLKLDQLIESQLTSEFADHTFGEMRELIEIVRNEDTALHSVMIMRLEGYRMSEIAKEHDCVRRTVERKIDRIRKILARHDVCCS